MRPRSEGKSRANLLEKLPGFRFADGEYAFYRGSLWCNGLYEQAESAEAIRNAIPAHAEDIRYVA